MLYKFLVLLILFPVSVLAQQKGSLTNQLAISQGISSPSMTHVTLFSKGFTQENPVALSYQSNYRGTVSLDGSDSTSFGLDFGVGDTKYGIALGVYSNGCDSCQAYVRGGLSAIWGGFGLGFLVQDGLYTMGMLFNPNGLHRLGAVLELEDNNGSTNNGIGYGRNAFGLGYSFVLPQFSFSLDLSKQAFDRITRNDDALILTPGIAIRVDIFSVSLSYDMYLNNTANLYKDQVWVGLTAHVTSDIQVTFYGEYVDRWTIMGSYYF